MVSLGFPRPAGVCRVDGGRREERIQAEGGLQPLLQGPEGHGQTFPLQGLRQCRLMVRTLRCAHLGQKSHCPWGKSLGRPRSPILHLSNAEANSFFCLFDYIQMETLAMKRLVQCLALHVGQQSVLKDIGRPEGQLFPDRS